MSVQKSSPGSEIREIFHLYGFEVNGTVAVTFCNAEGSDKPS